MLAKKVLGRFKDYGMYTWTDEHYVKLVDPPASGSNMVTFKGSDLGTLRGYLAYSKTGTAKVIIEKNPVFFVSFLFSIEMNKFAAFQLISSLTIELIL